MCPTSPPATLRREGGGLRVDLDGGLLHAHLIAHSRYQYGIKDSNLQSNTYGTPSVDTPVQGRAGVEEDLCLRGDDSLHGRCGSESNASCNRPLFAKRLVPA